MREWAGHPGAYQTLKGVCFFEARKFGCRLNPLEKYQTLKGVCFFEAFLSLATRLSNTPIPDAERRLLL